MATNKLQIDFGGLCLLVKQSEPAKLFVLMPQHTRMRHEAMIAWEVGDGTKDSAAFNAQRTLTLGVADNTFKPASIPPTVGNFSLYDGGTKLDAHWLTDVLPKECLSARVELPLNCMVEVPPGTAYAVANLRWKDGTSWPNQVLAGMVRVTVPADDQSLDTINDITSAKGKKFAWDGNGMAALMILNIPPGDLNTPPQRHPKGHKLAHIDAYFNLLRDCEADDADDPWLEASADVPGSVAAARTKRAAKMLGEESIEYIDPYQCTVGTGDGPN